MILDILYDGPNARSADERIAMRVLGHVHTGTASKFVAAYDIRINVIRISTGHTFNRIHQYHAEHSR